MDYLRLYTFARAHGRNRRYHLYAAGAHEGVFILGLFAVALLALSSFRLSAVLGP